MTDKQMIDQLKADYNKVIKTLMEIEEYCKDCNLKTDYTACVVLHMIDKGGVL